MLDASPAFCEQCGISRENLNRDSLVAQAGDLLRTCPGCGATCCQNCWNLRAGRCLSCVPFALPLGGEAPARHPAFARIGSGQPASCAGRAGRRTMRLSTVRHGLLGLAYVLVTLLIVTRSPLILAAFAAGMPPGPAAPAIESPAPEASARELGPDVTLGPTAAPAKTPRPSPHATKDDHQGHAPATAPRATPRPAPHQTPRPTQGTEDNGVHSGSTPTAAPVPQPLPSPTPSAPPADGSPTQGSGGSSSHD